MDKRRCYGRQLRCCGRPKQRLDLSSLPINNPLQRQASAAVLLWCDFEWSRLLLRKHFTAHPPRRWTLTR